MHSFYINYLIFCIFSSIFFCVFRLSMGSVVQKLDHFCVCNVLAHNSCKASTNCTIPASHHNPFVFFFSLLLPPANIYVSFMLISFTNGFSVTLYFVAVEVCPHSQNLTHTHQRTETKSTNLNYVFFASFLSF